MTDITIALDAMGGDFGPDVVIPAALIAIAKHPQLHLILVGEKDLLQQHLQSHHAHEHNQLSIHHASEVVGMDESPSQAMRIKKDSSMRVGINLVKGGQAQACVSAGNTGALMAIARFVLKTLPGIDRPAIISELPTAQGKTRALDLGANVDSSAEHLFQFAVMGSVLVSAVDNIDKPTVTLLNIGEEEIKGNDQVKRTAQLLADSNVINYIGYAEGDVIFKGTIDLVVCDGFVGNVALKSSEGIANLILFFIKEAFSKNIFTRILAFASIPVLKALKRRIDPATYNGASLLGLQGIVIKSHGGASVQGFANAIEEAIREVEHDVPKLIGERIAELYEAGQLL